jgi:hypothetical protein
MAILFFYFFVTMSAVIGFHMKFEVEKIKIIVDIRHRCLLQQKYIYFYLCFAFLFDIVNIWKESNVLIIYFNWKKNGQCKEKSFRENIQIKRKERYWHYIYCCSRNKIIIVGNSKCSMITSGKIWHSTLQERQTCAKPTILKQQWFVYYFVLRKTFLSVFSSIIF